jgi:signal transduction histidine kinase
LQAGALPIQRAAIEPAELLRAVVDEYRAPGRPAPDLRVTSDVPPVHADLRLLGRVLHNLIGNAYKHAGEHARVAIVAEPLNGAVRFAVDDDGPGIPDTERERVFERFIQGEGAGVDGAARHGSGLGLAFCKLAVEQLGGTIWAESSPFGGTRIAFTLPLAPTRKSDAPASLTTDEERAAAGSRVA